MLKMGDYPTYNCPVCQDEAPRIFEGFGFGFSKGGSASSNSGVHDHDYPNADKIVGRSAEQRWATYMERHRVKQQARKVGGTGALIRVDGDGYTDYEAMSPVGRKAREKLVDYAANVKPEK
jgi:hypothetical protein